MSLHIKSFLNIMNIFFNNFKSYYLLIFSFSIFIIIWISISSLQTFSPYPNHCREAADIITSIEIFNGNDPFDNSLKWHSYVYGPIFPALTALTAKIFNIKSDTQKDLYLNMQKTQRGIAWICISLFIIVFAYGLKKHEKTELLFSLVVATIPAIMLVTSTNEMGSKPGALAFLLFFCGLMLPYWRNFSFLSILLAIILLSIATFTKAYFIIGLFALSFYLLFKLPLKQYLLYILSTIAIFTLITFIIYAVYPESLSAYTANNLHVTDRADKLLMVRIFLDRQFTIILLFILCTSIFIKNNSQLNKLSFSNIKILIVKSYIIYLSIVFMIVYLFTLSKHNGNNLIYAYQLFFPFMIYSIASISYNNFINYKYALYICSFVISIFFMRSILHDLKYTLAMHKESKPQWDIVQSYIDTHDNILAFRSISPYLYIANKEPANSGQVEYTMGLLTNNNNKILNDKMKSYGSKTQNNIKQGKYDLLMLDYITKNNIISYNANGTPYTEQILNNLGYELVEKENIRTLWYSYPIGFFVKKLN